MDAGEEGSKFECIGSLKQINLKANKFMRSDQSVPSTDLPQSIKRMQALKLRLKSGATHSMRGFRTTLAKIASAGSSPISMRETQ